MKSIRLLYFVGAFAAIISANAQSSAVPPPPLAPGPLINLAPASAKWLVSKKAGPVGERDLANPQIKWDERMMVTKSGAIRYAISVNTTGDQIERWYDGAYEATVRKGQPPMLFAKGGTFAGAGDYTDFSKSDFPEFSWISAGNYVGVADMLGIKCIVFHTGGSGLDSTKLSGDIPQSGSTAYISVDGRLPVLLKTDSDITLYQWQQSPNTPLVLPADVAAVFDNAIQRMKASEAPVMIP